MLPHKEFEDLITKVEARPTYLAHVVLDRGLDRVLVLTTDRKWFMYSDHKWKEINSAEAHVVSDNHYKAYIIDEMLNTK